MSRAVTQYRQSRLACHRRILWKLYPASGTGSVAGIIMWGGVCPRDRSFYSAQVPRIFRHLTSASAWQLLNLVPFSFAARRKRIWSMQIRICVAGTVSGKIASAFNGPIMAGVRSTLRRHSHAEHWALGMAIICRAN